MSKEIKRLPEFDGATALDAAEVKALFAALRSTPGAVESLREAFAHVKERLTPSGRTAYRRELARLLSARPAVPQCPSDLLDGEYGLAVRGDDCSEMLANLRCEDGRLALDLPVAQLDISCRIEIGAGGEFSVKCEGEHQGNFSLAIGGALAVRDGYLFLEAKLTGIAGAPAHPVRLRLTGTGDARSGQA